jgi:hypothetical protein
MRREWAGNVLVDGLDVFGLEGRTADDEGVQNDADGPGVDFEAVAVDGVEEDLWGDIIRSAAYCLFALPGALDECCEAKIADLDVHVCVEEEVAELEIAVDDLVGVHIVAGADELNHEEAGFGLGEAAAAAEHVHEGSTGTEFEGHVDVLVIFEAFLESNNVGVFEGAVDLNFCVELMGDEGGLATGNCGALTFVLAFLVLSELFVTTLHASLTPRRSLTS